MSGKLDTPRRRIVPRWRPSKVQARLNPTGERPSAAEPDGQEEVAELLRQFRETGSAHVASDLMGAAYVFGCTEEALEAARHLLRAAHHAPPVAVEIAKTLVEGVDTPVQPTVPGIGELARRERIAGLRTVLRASPRNPLTWLDLAREQAILGQTAAASRPIRISLALAPNSRLVLRSASRYYLHAEERERAHDILRRTPRVGSEPALLAAEIAAAGAAGRTSRLIKHGRRLVRSGQFSPRGVSELAAALGTIEAEAGSGRAARKLLTKSLEDPTENAVAQCSWLANKHRLGSFEVPPQLFQTPRSFEANAWALMNQGEYEESVVSAMDWLHDEPFASRPAAHGSFLSSMVLGRYDEAADFATQGLIANPHDPYLLNNATFAYGINNKLDEAQLYLNRLNQLSLEPEHRPMHLATSGLIAYRNGDAVLGRDLYKRAAQAAIELGRYTEAVWALLLAAREEDLIEPRSGDLLRDEALKYVDRLGQVDRAVTDVLLGVPNR